MSEPDANIDRLQIASFCQKHHIKKLALFGSAVRKESSQGSDLDVLVEFEEGHVPGLAFFAMEVELSGLVGKKVDLNTPGFLGRSFRKRVLDESRVYYALP